MSKLWLVAVHEYKRQVLTRGFVVAILIVPLLLALTIGLGMLTDRLRNDPRPVGYVDRSGLLSRAIQVEGSPALIGYAAEDEARLALEAGQIQAYFVVAGDYLQSRQVQMVYFKAPGSGAYTQFRRLLRSGLLADHPPEVIQRVLDGTFITARTADGIREYTDRAAVVQILPLMFILVFMILIASNASTLVETVVKEKENRTVEVVVTSVSPGQLMGGKVLAVVGMGLTQLLGWGLCAAVALLIGRNVLGWQWVRYLRLHPQVLITIAVTAGLTYVFYGALQAALGATVADLQESQQIGALFAFPMAIPMWAIVVLVEQPHSIPAIALTLIPFTALPTLCVRMAFATVPLWQIAVSCTLLAVCAVGSVWLAGRAFRLGMLRYGQRLNWRELFRPGVGKANKK